MFAHRPLPFLARLAAGFRRPHLGAVRKPTADQIEATHRIAAALEAATPTLPPAMPIKIEFAPIAPRRRATTREIAAALLALKATPRDATGNPASFVVPVKHRCAVRSASADTGIPVRTRLEESTDAEGVVCRVLLASAPSAADQTAPLPFDEAPPARDPIMHKAVCDAAVYGAGPG